MHQPPNRLLRILVPAALLLIGLGIAVAVLKNTASTPASKPLLNTPQTAPSSAAPSAAAPAKPEKTADAVTQPPTVPSVPAGSAARANAAPAPPAPAGPKPVLSARVYPFTSYAPVGSLDESSKYEMQLQFSPFGAGFDDLTLTNYFTTINKAVHERLQHFTPLPAGTLPDPRVGVAGFAMNKIDVLYTDASGKEEAVPVELGLTPAPAGAITPASATTFWKQTAPGTFEATIADAQDHDVLRITRTYALEPGHFDFTLRQRVENLGSQPVKIVWHQFGPMDQPVGVIHYGGDVRRVRFGYLLPQSLDPDRIVQSADITAAFLSHQQVLGKAAGKWANGLDRWDPKDLWPNDDSTKRDLSLSWAATTSRYFTVAMTPAVNANAAKSSSPGPVDHKVFSLVKTIDRFAIPEAPDAHARGSQGVSVMRLNSVPLTIAPGASADVSMNIYAGPTYKRVMNKEPAASAVGLSSIVIYTFGGPCGWCTFQFLAEGLRAYLLLLHNFVVFDWGIAIIVLVLSVRTILHPVTRWSQTRLYHFGKQMQSLGPKQKALQEKYKGDPAKLREETGRLMREEGISMTGALGCLPMLLQSPIWYALTAMLLFAFDLRHQPGFFGAFQAVSGGKWGFLGDLAEPDSFIHFPHALWIPGLSTLMGSIEGLNVLPIILGVVFFLQQKYLTPPSTTQLTPEQEQQQKIMKGLTVVMFPLFMYNAPSGLALYFMMNSTLGIFESRWIRHRAEEQDAQKKARKAAGGLPSPAVLNRKAPFGKKIEQPKSFMDRVREAVEDRQKQMAQQQKRQAKKKK